MFKYLLSKIFTNKVEVINYTPEFLEPYCTLFGSRRWNVHTNKSDVDYIAKDTNINIIKQLLEMHAIPFRVTTAGYQDVVQAIYFSINNLTYEISILDERKFEIYGGVITILDSFAIENRKFTKKEYRVGIFIMTYHFVVNKDMKIPTELRTHLANYYPEYFI